MKHFEMANGDNPEEIILATQRSVMTALKNVVINIRKDTKQPGLTWEQLDYLFDSFEKKQPEIIIQRGPM